MYGASLGIFKEHVSAYISFCISLPNFVQIRPSTTELWRHILFFKTTATESQFYFRFRFTWLCSCGKVGIYLHRKILAWYPNHRPIYNYFRFLKTNVRQVGIYGCFTIGMSFCICLQNFVQTGPSATELWRHNHLSNWRPRHRNCISGFSFPAFGPLGRSKSTCIPNFGEIFQSTAEILLLPFSENKRPTCWNSTSVSDFYVYVAISMSFCICVPISSKSDHSRQSYDVILILKMAAMASQFYFRFRFSWFRSSGKWKSTSVYQISTRYLNTRLRYFRFQKTNVRHVGTLLPVPIFTFASPLACYFV